MRHLLATSVAAASLLACAHQNQLVPAPGASIAGQPRVAEETVAGVRIQVDSSAWKWGRVSDVLAPVQVQIENRSDHPLRVAYSQFTLGGRSGFRATALPPFQVAAANAAPVEPEFAFRGGFFIAPWEARFYRHGLAVWGGPLWFDAPYYGANYGLWPAAQPDEDVLRRALPEGVLEPGGQVSGFLYFANQPKGAELVFLATLMDAGNGQVFGTIQIPFTVK